MSSSIIRVLYIDDEVNNLVSFKATFRRQYEVYTVNSAFDGLKILDNIDIQIVIADQKMPKMTGVEFFKKISKTHPDTMRILLTGFTDIEALTGAINDGEIYRYIQKPWVDLELHNTIKNAFDAYTGKINLRNKISELEKTNDELNRFIYSISHELRAPLVSIIGIINLVKLEKLYDSSGEYWNLIERCSNKLDYYIQKTLQYYKNNKAEEERTEIDFKTLIDELVTVQSYSDHDTNFIINVNQNVIFRGDFFRIEVILGNLISNAIKYQKANAQNKKVSIKVNVTNSTAEISINDNGIGILTEHLEKIFAQFFKSKVHQGSGLGLFIVKEALNKINGRISVNSNINLGTTFTITIPNAK